MWAHKFQVFHAAVVMQEHCSAWGRAEADPLVHTHDAHDRLPTAAPRHRPPPPPRPIVTVIDCGSDGGRRDCGVNTDPVSVHTVTSDAPGHVVPL